MNPDDATRLGISSGDRVTVRSRRGTAEASALVTPTVQPGQIFLPMHFGTLHKTHLPVLRPALAPAQLKSLRRRRSTLGTLKNRSLKTYHCEKACRLQQSIWECTIHRRLPRRCAPRDDKQGSLPLPPKGSAVVPALAMTEQRTAPPLRTARSLRPTNGLPSPWPTPASPPQPLPRSSARRADRACLCFGARAYGLHCAASSPADAADRACRCCRDAAAAPSHTKRASARPASRAPHHCSFRNAPARRPHSG
ncbi:MAG: hypothetical protein CK548_01160 [Opitutia bacterium]|nr:MAG: hypothetical protein CK548_01160 [Opitutae bacterium]